MGFVLPLVVHDAEPVRIAIGRQADLRAGLFYRLTQRAEILANGLGIDATEQRVAVGPYRFHSTGRFGEDGFQLRATTTVHRVHDNPQPVTTNLPEIDDLLHGRHVSG